MNSVEYKGIWVFAELENGLLSQTPLELLAKARDLKKSLGGADTVTAVLLGSSLSGISDTLFAYGAEQVIALEDEKLEPYKHRVYTEALVELVKKYKPSIFLLPASPMGRELAPRVMCALGTGLTADAIDLGVDQDGTFVQTTPNFGGNILSHIAIPEKRPQMVTVHPKVFSPITPVGGASGTLIRERLALEDDEAYQILGREEKPTTGTPIDKASVIVSGGFGIKEQADLDMLQELAGLIGGQVGCSRPLAENGWLGHECQIGQSGTTVSPKLIINIAISGSVQYASGMDKSKCVISINRDPSAPIYDLSHYGAVADYKVLIPAIINEIKGRKAL